MTETSSSAGGEWFAVSSSASLVRVELTSSRSASVTPFRSSRLWLLLSLMLLLISNANASQIPEGTPQSLAGFQGQMVWKVDVAIQPEKDSGQVRALIKQQSGQPFSVEEINESVSALQRTKEFDQVQLSIEPEASGLRVIFILQPVYRIGLISFPGADRQLSYPLLLQAVNIPLDAPFVRDSLPEREQALQRFFVKEGYFAAAVVSKPQVDDAHRLVNVVFQCELGQRAKIGNITVHATSPQEDAEVEHTLRSFWARVSGASLQSGQTYSRRRIEKAVDHLRTHFRRSGHLAPKLGAEPSFDSDTNHADLAFNVDPGPLVSVRIEGAHIWKRTMRKLVPIYQEESVDQDLVDEGERNLLSYFQSKSYFDVRVNSQIEKANDRVTVTYRVNRGSRHRVSSVLFVGNKHFSDAQLRSRVSVQQAKFLFDRGHFSQVLLKGSTTSIITLYRNAGYARAAVTPQVSDRDPDLAVTFQIVEGEPDRVRTLRIVDPNGNTIQPKIRRPLELAPGGAYSPHIVEDDRNRILAAYLNRGYPNVNFDSTASPSPDDPHGFDVVYKIDEGREVITDDPVLLGANHTNSNFLLGLLRKNVKKGQPLSQEKLLQSESDLYNLGVFDWASVMSPESYQPSNQPDDQDVLIRLHESKRNTLDVGGGLEVIPRSGNIPVGAVALPGLPPVSLGSKFTTSQKSFIGPRGLLQFARHNLRGRAETAALGFVFSRLDQRASFTYADPDLHGTEWSSLFSVSAERTTQYSIYTAVLGQASFQVEKQLNRQHTQKVVARYSYQRTDLTNVTIPDLVLPQDRRVKLSTFSAEYVRDTRDKPLDAHHGQYQTLSFGVTPTAFGSSADFVRFLGQTSFYKPVRPWLVWANNFRLGLAVPFAGSSVPLSERFFTGGPDSLRGFPINGAGPQRPVSVCSDPSNPATCTLINVPVGGDMLAIVNSEARFPIPLKENLGGVIFYDGGNVYSNINAHQFVSNYTNSIGIGFRYNTRIGPIRIDIGRNLNPIPGVKATQYFITLGQAF